MPKTRQEQAEIVYARLREVEDSVELALQKAFAFAAEIPVFRKSARLAHTTGQQIFEANLKACNALVEARGSMTECHHECNDLRVSLGLRRPTAGVGDDKPPYDPRRVFSPEDDPSLTKRPLTDIPA